MSGGCACHSTITPELLAEVDKLLEPHKGHAGNLIQVLHKTQSKVGYLPREIQVRVAESLDVPLAKVYGVVSFYSFFTTRPKGRHTINVCTGTACYVRGASQLLSQLTEDVKVKPGATSDDGQFSLGVVRCLGACGLGPVVTVDDNVYGRVHKAKLADIISEYASE